MPAMPPSCCWLFGGDAGQERDVLRRHQLPPQPRVPTPLTRLRYSRNRRSALREKMFCRSSSLIGAALRKSTASLLELNG